MLLLRGEGSRGGSGTTHKRRISGGTAHGARFNEPVGTGPETVGTGPTGPDRFRPVPNRSKFKI
jgi:hypothetical protein